MKQRAATQQQNSRVKNNPLSRWPSDPNDPDDRSDPDDDELSLFVGLGVFPAAKPDVSALGPPAAPLAIMPVPVTAVAPGAATGAPGLTTAPPLIAGREGTAAISEGSGVGAAPTVAGAPWACTCDLGSWALPGTTTPPAGATAGSGAGVGDGDGVGDGSVGVDNVGVGDGADNAAVDAGGVKLSMLPMLNCPIFALGSLMASTCPEATAPGHFCCTQVTTGVIPFCV